LRWSERYTKTDMVYLASTGWWANLGTVVISLCSLLLYIVFANFLPKETYGMYQYLLSLAAIVSAFTLTGMNSAVARSVAQGFDGALKEAVGVQLRWGLLPFLGALAASAYYFINGNLLLSGGLLVIGIIVPINAAFNMYAAFLNGKQDFKRGFFYGMGWNLPYYGALILTALLSDAVLMLLLANLLSQAIALCFFYYKTLKIYKPSEATDPTTVPYGKHLSVMNLLNAIAAQMDTVMAFQFLGPIDLARYSFATAIPERFGSFFKFIQTAALPRFSQKTQEQVRGAFGHRIWWAVLATTVGAAVYAALAPFVFKLLFPAYVEVIPYTQLYSLIIIASLSGLFVTALTAGKNIRELYIFNIASPLLQLGLQFAGVVLFGLLGLIVGKILSNFLTFGLAIVLLLVQKEERPIPKG